MLYKSNEKVFGSLEMKKEKIEQRHCVLLTSKITYIAGVGIELHGAISGTA